VLTVWDQQLSLLTEQLQTLVTKLVASYNSVQNY